MTNWAGGGWRHVPIRRSSDGIPSRTEAHTTAPPEAPTSTSPGMTVYSAFPAHCHLSPLAVNLCSQRPSTPLHLPWVSRHLGNWHVIWNQAAAALPEAPKYSICPLLTKHGTADRRRSVYYIPTSTFLGEGCGVWCGGVEYLLYVHTSPPHSRPRPLNISLFLKTPHVLYTIALYSFYIVILKYLEYVSISMGTRLMSTALVNKTRFIYI